MRRRLDKKLHKWCWYCGVQLTRRTFSKDHQVPKSRGGSGWTDLVYCCKPCNTEKAAMNVEEFRLHRFGNTTELFHGEKVNAILEGKPVRSRNYSVL